MPPDFRAFAISADFFRRQFRHMLFFAIEPPFQLSLTLFSMLISDTGFHADISIY
jgi:hypothetical protein